MNKAILILILIIMGGSVSDSPAQEVTVNDLAVLAYESNPEIVAAREDWRAKIEKYNISTAYPDPQFMITYFPEPIETRLGPQDWNVNISQVIPFPGKLSKAGEVIQADTRIAKLNLDKTIRRVMASILKSYHELVYIQQAKKIALQNSQLLDRLRSMGESAYAQDRAAFTDVVKSQSQTAQLRYDILLLEELEQTEKTRINGLLNREPGFIIGDLKPIPVKPVVYKLEELYSLAEIGQEDILMADLKVEKAGIQSDLAEYQNFPNFKVGIFYAGIGESDMDIDDSGDDAIGVQFGMSIPLWFGKNKSRTLAANALIEKTKAVRAVQVNNTRTQIHTLYFKLQNAQRLMALYKDEMLPQAVNALETSETWFREGQGSFSDFVETQAAAYNFQLSLARARADYGKILAGLELLTGRELTETQEPAVKKNENINHEKSAILTLKADWEKNLESHEPESSFYQPDAQALKKLLPVSLNKDKTVRTLKNRFTLETLEILTLLRNAGIKSAKNKVSAEIQSFTQVSNLDEILGQYTAFTEGLMTGIGPMRGKDSIKMKYPFPGVTALKGQVVNQSVNAAKESLEIARRDALTSAKKTYWNLVYIHKAKSIIFETLEMFRRLESVANTRYKAGKTSFQDVIKVTIKTKILEDNLLTLKGKQKNLESALLALMDLPAGTRIGKPIAQRIARKLPSLDRLYSSARKNRQELRQMQAKITKMENMIEMAETMILPGLSLNFSVYEDEAVVQAGSSAMKPSFPETTSASMGAGLPKKPWFGTNNAWLNQTRQTLEAMKQNLKKAETATDNMVRNAWFELDKSRREAALFQNTIVGLSESALDVSTRGYESGSVSFADVIASYTSWLDVRLSLARKNSDMGVARAELEKVAGKIL